jgi:hypothetical protein
MRWKASAASGLCGGRWSYSRPTTGPITCNSRSKPSHGTNSCGPLSTARGSTALGRTSAAPAVMCAGQPGAGRCRRQSGLHLQRGWMFWRQRRPDLQLSASLGAGRPLPRNWQCDVLS